ncbi:MAG: hypothetical protein LBL72_08390 [Candidatus Accumulibacter sp.]|jgi:prophage tail gpP-like protein|nr:hypothetical protein [Accumulibacter sp.]
MSADRMTLKVGGQIYAGWKSVSVQTSMEQISGAYNLEITERWPNQPKDWSIPPGELCEVLIGETPVISGYVDRVSVSYDATSHKISVSGRDRTGDLVDCSAASTAFSGLRFSKIAEKLCAPYKISIVDETHGDADKIQVPKFAVQNGESGFKTLEKLARQIGVLLTSDGLGHLVITRAGLSGRAHDALIHGRNILTASFSEDHSELFSEITVKGQASTAGSQIYNVSTAGPSGKVSTPRVVRARSGNSAITRHRPLILIAETQADARRCRQRAKWEAGHREGKSRKISVSVQGWRQSDGTLWRINRIARVVCPWMRVDGDWLISSVNYSLGDAGTKSELSLVDRRAFELLPEIPPRTASYSGKNAVLPEKKT